MISSAHTGPAPTKRQSVISIGFPQREFSPMLKDFTATTQQEGIVVQNSSIPVHSLSFCSESVTHPNAYRTNNPYSLVRYLASTRFQRLLESLSEEINSRDLRFRCLRTISYPCFGHPEEYNSCRSGPA
jgi:hypothetical protein